MVENLRLGRLTRVNNQVEGGGQLNGLKWARGLPFLRLRLTKTMRHLTLSFGYFLWFVQERQVSQELSGDLALICCKTRFVPPPGLLCRFVVGAKLLKTGYADPLWGC